MDVPAGIQIDPQLWEALRALAYRAGMTPSQFLTDAFRAEAGRLRTAQAMGLAHPLGEKAQSSDALAELAIRNAIRDLLKRLDGDLGAAAFER